MARLGGDEFALLHPVSPASKSLTAIATELVQSIARPYDVAGSELTLTASVGVSVAGEPGRAPKEHLRNKNKTCTLVSGPHRRPAPQAVAKAEWIPPGRGCGGATHLRRRACL